MQFLPVCFKMFNAVTVRNLIHDNSTCAWLVFIHFLPFFFCDASFLHFQVAGTGQLPCTQHILHLEHIFFSKAPKIHEVFIFSRTELN